MKVAFPCHVLHWGPSECTVLGAAPSLRPRSSWHALKVRLCLDTCARPPVCCFKRMVVNPRARQAKRDKQQKIMESDKAKVGSEVQAFKVQT
jgi:hypothetical protein